LNPDVQGVLSGIDLLSPEYGPWALIAGLLVFTFVSEDLACLAAGGLAAAGRLSFPEATAACFIGIFAGDMMLYWAGRLFAGPLLRGRVAGRFVTSDRLESSSRWLADRGASAVFLSRFVAGLRLPTYLAAGALKADFGRFAFWFAVAAAVWTPLLVGSVAFAGSKVSPAGILATSLMAWLTLRAILRLTDKHTRSTIANRFRRTVKWEFWPVKVFYVPVVFYVVYLGLKHRGLTVFTAADPAFPAGGFVGESKHEIYRLISHSPAAGPHLLKHRSMPADLEARQKLTTVESFLTENDLSFPLVVKPDQGERGRGVVVARDLDDLGAALDTGVDLLVQEYCPGVEASVFYYRRPSEPGGRIFSITEKRFPTVTGDGVSDLQTLIQNDPRAKLIADRYIDHNREKIDDIPAPGERVELIDIGSHSRGCIFLDGEWLRTKALDDEIDKVCRGIPGFYFGRFDLRATSFDALRRGEFKIVELNGVTSESTNIYDPRYNLVAAYRTLFRQWRLAFEIGAENVDRGAKASTIKELLTITRDGLYHTKSPRPAGGTATQCA
jgi:membrane protein DedA with SNARE-associated domain